MATPTLPAVGNGETSRRPKPSDFILFFYIQVHGLMLAIFGTIYLAKMLHEDTKISHEVLLVTSIILGICRVLIGLYYLLLLIRQRRLDADGLANYPIQEEEEYSCLFSLLVTTFLGIVIILAGLWFSGAYSLGIATWTFIFCAIDVVIAFVAICCR